MKKLILGALLLCTIASNAQSVFGQAGLSDGHLLRNRVIDYKDNSIAGSPYIDTKFFYAEIAGIEGSLMMRYNAHRDEFEVKKREGDNNDELFSLPKDDQYNTITGKFNNTIIKLKEYKDFNDNHVKGYLYELANNNGFALYKRLKVVLIKEKEGNGYEGYQPPKFVQGNTEYYIGNPSNEIIPFPKNKKELIKMFPDKKAQIDTFLKDYKIKFSNEEDQVKIINMISK